MSIEGQLVQELKKLVRPPEMLFPVAVISVDKTNRTVKVIDAAGIEYPDARLNAIIKDSDHVTVFPKEKSVVQVTPIGSESAGHLLVVAVHDPEAVELSIGEITASIDGDGIKLNGDSEGGLVLAKELKKQVDKNTEVLKQLKNILSGTPIPEPGNGSPSALQTALNAVTSALPVADLSKIENEKVKQG